MSPAFNLFISDFCLAACSLLVTFGKVFEPGQDELPESAPTAEEASGILMCFFRMLFIYAIPFPGVQCMCESCSLFCNLSDYTCWLQETQRDGVPEEGAILGFLKQKLSECSRESAERTKIWTDVAKGPRGGPTSSRAPTSFHMKGIMLTTPNKPTFLNVPEMTPDPVDPVAKKGLLREKREEVAAKGRSKGANKGERAKKTKAQVKTVKSKPQKRQPNNGPMEAAFRKFVEKQKKVGVHYWKALKMWKVSPERGTIIASMSPSEQKRRRFA